MISYIPSSRTNKANLCDRNQNSGCLTWVGTDWKWRWGKFFQWWKWYKSWLEYWLHKCMHLPKLSKLYTWHLCVLLYVNLNSIFLVPGKNKIWLAQLKSGILLSLKNQFLPRDQTKQYRYGQRRGITECSAVTHEVSTSTMWY